MEWIWEGHAKDMARTQSIHIESKVLDTIWHTTLPILEYIGIIDYSHKLLMDYIYCNTCKKEFAPHLTVFSRNG